MSQLENQAAVTQAAILNALPAHIALIDHLGTILEVNESWRLLAREDDLPTRGCSVGDNYLEVCEQAQGEFMRDAQDAANGIRKVLTGESAQFSLDYSCPSSEGKRWFRLMATPLSPYALTGAVVMHVDITRRKTAEDALHASEYRLRTIFESEPECVTVVSVAGELLDINPAGIRMLDAKDKVSVLGQSIFEFIHPDDRIAFIELHSAATGGKSGQLHFRMVSLSGTERWSETHSTPLRETGGDVTSVLSVTRDITERKQSAERLAEQASLLDHATDAIWVRDLNHRITYWNKGAQRLYGWSAEEAMGRSALELMRPKDMGAIHQAVQQLLIHGEWSGELQNTAQDGRAITVQARWTLLRDELQQPKAALIINTDITERKRLEQQFLRAQRMESIGTLAGGIAHDLNNVLTPIGMAIDLLKMQETNPGRLSMLSTIEGSAKRGSDMVRQVLSFARGVEGDQSQVEIKRIVNEVAHIADETFLKAIQVFTQVDSELWQVLGDSTQLHQVLLNLCVNARDAMPEGGKLIISADNVMLDTSHSAVEPDARPGPYIQIRVEDTGSGMTHEVAQRMFEPFFTTKDTGRGTGLGLSTTLGIVRSHHGFIRVCSEPGRGTSMTVYLPALTNPQNALQKTAPLQIPRGKGELILLVDDEDAIRQITRQSLECFGYRVIMATNGAEGVRAYEAYQDQIAAVLTDMMMPTMDGPAMIQILVRMNPNVLIIAASGVNTKAMAAKAVSAGVKHFIPKPYTADIVLTSLGALLQGQLRK
ncbi:MAG: PAS domain S-box protein [Prosthecobacter sp.]|nr:PAS domain S-box protein [Prosthecobacter sp.]